MDTPTFTKKEIHLLSDTDFLQTKRRILEKIKLGLKSCREAIDETIHSGNYLIDTEYLQNSPKISAGDNYRGLPYVVLDNPRFFTKNAVFSYRVMLLWGNFISFSLHLEGPYTPEAIKSIQVVKQISSSTFFCTGPTPWEYHFEKDNYESLNNLSPEDIQSHFEKYQFLKIAKKATLEEWPFLNNLATRNLQILAELVNLVRQS